MVVIGMFDPAACYGTARGKVRCGRLSRRLAIIWGFVGAVNEERGLAGRNGGGSLFELGWADPSEYLGVTGARLAVTGARLAGMVVETCGLFDTLSSALDAERLD